MLYNKISLVLFLLLYIAVVLCVVIGQLYADFFDIFCFMLWNLAFYALPKTKGKYNETVKYNV